MQRSHLASRGLASPRAERGLLSRAGVVPPRRPDAFVAQIEDTRADWCARGVPGAAAREINKIPAARRLIEESIARAADMSRSVTPGSGSRSAEQIGW